MKKKRKTLTEAEVKEAGINPKHLKDKITIKLTEKEPF